VRIFGNIEIVNRKARSVDDEFLVGYYNDDHKTWRNTYWLGVETQKCPADMWVFQEIMQETRPDLIIEAGTNMGGSALFFASMFDLLGGGEIITIDVLAHSLRPEHPRITYLQGSSTDHGIIEEVTRRAKAAQRVMVVLDSDHSKAHVLDELRQLGPLVSPGCYLIVEDTIVNGNPVLPAFGPGPAEAVEQFLGSEGTPFIVDREREKFHLTFNRGGYLRRTE
jgi:cephalosporin hydroxylase